MQPEDTGGKTHFEICTGKASLHQGFLRVRRNGGIAGGDGQTIEQFGKGLQERLDALSQNLREGTYNPGDNICLYCTPDHAVGFCRSAGPGFPPMAADHLVLI